MISVENYLNKLKLAKRSPQTIKGYAKVMKSFADYLHVSVDDLHNHLTPDNLTGYAASRIEAGKSPAGTGTNIRILHNYYKLNGIRFDTLDSEILKNPGVLNGEDEPDDIGDKALTPELLQRMIDQGNVHSRAIITFLISTGARAGESSKLKLSNIGRLENGKFIPDINGDVIEIPHSIAKGKVKNGKKTGGGLVFLNAEARQYLTDWLKERDAYIKDADIRAKSLIGIEGRPANDQRIFANSYNSMYRIFDRLYKKADGEQGTYRSRCTMHSARKYFRTHLVETVLLDVVEFIMRHSGYLTGSYVRYPPEEIRKLFHVGEAALYITRADHRIQSGKLSQLERENQDMQDKITQLQNVVAMLSQKSTPETDQEARRRMSVTRDE